MHIACNNRKQKMRLEKLIKRIIKAGGTNSKTFWNIVRNYKHNNLGMH